MATLESTSGFCGHIQTRVSKLAVLDDDNSSLVSSAGSLKANQVSMGQLNGH